MSLLKMFAVIILFIIIIRSSHPALPVSSLFYRDVRIAPLGGVR